jgi:glycosyltransferase involved in cell wall biosynthesis
VGAASLRIVVAARCYNESKNIERFMRGYDFADEIIISDGGSDDDSVSKLQKYPKVHLFHYEEYEVVNGQRWNPDSGHMNFVIDLAKTYNPDWIIFDDMDDVPNQGLRDLARPLLELMDERHVQVNAFRLYLWGDTGKFYPQMNDNFNPAYTSLWAWRPNKINIHANMEVRHGTLVGLDSSPYRVELPYCLLHKSWNPDTIDKKIERYNALGLPMNPLSTFAGEAMDLPEWGYE